MTLSDIETILTTLTKRHAGLDEEMLDTLLLSANFDDATIKEMKAVFRQLEVPLPVIIQKEELQIVRAKKEERKGGIPAPTELEILPVLADVEVPFGSNEPLTFYTPDGAEEKDLHAFKDEEENVRKKEIEEIEEKEGPRYQEEPLDVQKDKPFSTLLAKDESLLKKETIATHEEPQTISEEEVRSVEPTSKDLLPQKEPESLIVHEEVKQRGQSKDSEIPSNLPLLPFESSPHVWSFARYKDVFHGDGAQKEVLAIDIPTVQQYMPSIPLSTSDLKESASELPVIPSIDPLYVKDEGVDLEKTPLTKGDESMVVLAGVMLLVILLILGYMYANNRL